VVKWLLFSSTELETKVFTKLVVVVVEFGTNKCVIANCKKRKSLFRNTLWFIGKIRTYWNSRDYTNLMRPWTTSWSELLPTFRCQYDPSKRLKIFHERHGITSQKTWIFKNSALRTWNVTVLSLSVLETQKMAFTCIWCPTVTAMEGLSINNSLIHKRDVEGRHLKKLHHVTAEVTYQVQISNRFAGPENWDLKRDIRRGWKIGESVRMSWKKRIGYSGMDE
jgi:hypothetical protein